MTIDELIDWLNAISCQCDDVTVTLDDRYVAVNDIAKEAAERLENMCCLCVLAITGDVSDLKEIYRLKI